MERAFAFDGGQPTGHRLARRTSGGVGAPSGLPPSRADAGSAHRSILLLGRAAGNRAVQRAVAEPGDTAVQRDPYSYPTWQQNMDQVPQGSAWNPRTRSGNPFADGGPAAPKTTYSPYSPSANWDTAGNGSGFSPQAPWAPLTQPKAQPDLSTPTQWPMDQPGGMAPGADQQPVYPPGFGQPWQPPSTQQPGIVQPPPNPYPQWQPPPFDPGSAAPTGPQPDPSPPFVAPTDSEQQDDDTAVD